MCDRHNSNHPSQSFTCVSVLYEDTTHPSDDQQQGHSITSIRHAASDTTDIHSTVHLQWGSSWMSEMTKLSERHPSISDSSYSSNLHLTSYPLSSTFIGCSSTFITCSSKLIALYEPHIGRSHFSLYIDTRILFLQSLGI